STLLMADIRDILIITTPQDNVLFRQLLGDGSHLGVSLSFATQDKPRGIAEAFIIARDFVGKSSAALILGDNIFYGQGLLNLLRSAQASPCGATIFAYVVADPERYGWWKLTRAGGRCRLRKNP